MQWNEQKSILLSRVLVWIFAAAIVLLDLGSLVLCLLPNKPILYTGTIMMNRTGIIWLAVCCWLCSGFGYLLLYRMNCLLTNLQQEQVFVPENVRHLRVVSICCFAACCICLVFGLKMPTLLTVTLPAGFVGLIVRIVKNVFENAIAMKDELDYTV